MLGSRLRAEGDTYKLEEESVFPECSDAPCKSQNEHHSAHHQEEPDGVEAAEVCDGGDVGQDSLGAENTQQGIGCGLVLHREKVPATVSYPLRGHTAAEEARD